MLESTDGVLCVGSGSPYALSAAKALMGLPDNSMDAEEIGRRAMKIAAETCVYTNR